MHAGEPCGCEPAVRLPTHGLPEEGAECEPGRVVRPPPVEQAVAGDRVLGPGHRRQDEREHQEGCQDEDPGGQVKGLQQGEYIPVFMGGGR